jgi:hypothetical protein
MTTESPRDNENFPKRRRAISISLIFALLLGCSPLVLGPLIGIWSYSPIPAVSQRATVLSTIILLGCLSPMFFQIITLSAAIGNQGHRMVILGNIACFLFLICSLLMFRTMRLGPFGERDIAITRIANSSLPLIHAIERFEIDHKGEPPSTLEELMPTYLDAIPSTGVARYNDYRYAVDSDPQSAPGPVSRWLLRVTTMEFGAWDSMYYLPDQNYAEAQSKHSLDSIPMSDGRNWVYFNE